MASTIKKHTWSIPHLAHQTKVVTLAFTHCLASSWSDSPVIAVAADVAVVIAAAVAVAAVAAVAPVAAVASLTKGYLKLICWQNHHE